MHQPKQKQHSTQTAEVACGNAILVPSQFCFSHCQAHKELSRQTLQCSKVRLPQAKHLQHEATP